MQSPSFLFMLRRSMIIIPSINLSLCGGIPLGVRVLRNSVGKCGCTCGYCAGNGRRHQPTESAEEVASQVKGANPLCLGCSTSPSVHSYVTWHCNVSTACPFLEARTERRCWSRGLDRPLFQALVRAKSHLERIKRVRCE